MDGAQKLRVFMAEQRLRVNDAAARLCVSPSYLSHIRAGRQKPGRKLAADIERLTGGAVPMSAWDAGGADRTDAENAAA